MIDQLILLLLMHDATTAYHRRSQWLLHLLRAPAVRLVSFFDCDWYDHVVESSQRGCMAQEQTILKHHSQSYLH